MNKKTHDDSTLQEESTKKDEPPICGIVRPIASSAGYTEQHWIDVHGIIEESVRKSQYIPRLVSESVASGVIISSIVQNLYNDPIVICDVSSRNPNVMFELGMRIAFQKPVIIIADDDTPFSFDISPIKHLVYPRTLRFQVIKIFQEKLSNAIRATVDEAQKPGYVGYLQQFGNLKITNIDNLEITQEEVIEKILTGMRDLKNEFAEIKGKGNFSETPRSTIFWMNNPSHVDAEHPEIYDVSIEPTKKEQINSIKNYLYSNTNVRRAILVPSGAGFLVQLKDNEHNKLMNFISNVEKRFPDALVMPL